jgi:hypothetical protein
MQLIAIEIPNARPKRTLTLQKDLKKLVMALRLCCHRTWDRSDHIG